MGSEKEAVLQVGIGIIDSVMSGDADSVTGTFGVGEYDQLTECVTSST